jgi:hypothetical protein
MRPEISGGAVKFPTRGAWRATNVAGFQLLKNGARRGGKCKFSARFFLPVPQIVEMYA